MENYILVSFWTGVVTVVIRALFLSFSNYPRNSEISMGVDVVASLIGVGFCVWAGALLWFN
ncbi:hypothetical protein OAA60_05540 [Porticoccaceae bacterium]|nr:hypothetical protein [Porticoccaceae bacterium]